MCTTQLDVIGRLPRFAEAFPVAAARKLREPGDAYALRERRIAGEFAKVRHLFGVEVAAVAQEIRQLEIRVERILLERCLEALELGDPPIRQCRACRQIALSLFEPRRISLRKGGNR